ncbi:hypothetical protein AUP68_14611 [Ilyonectria robusta]
MRKLTIIPTVLTVQATTGEAGYVSAIPRQPRPGLRIGQQSANHGQQLDTFFMFGSFCILMGIFVWFFVPETKGLIQEKTYELFGVTELVKRLGNDSESNDSETGDTELRSIREEPVGTKG